MWCDERLNAGEHFQISETIRNGRWMALALALLFTAACLALRGHVPTSFLLAWMGLFLIECIVKMLVSFRFIQASIEDQKRGVWRRAIWAGSIYSGAVYGLASLVLIMPLPQDTLAVLFTVYGGIIILMCVLTTQYLPTAWLATFPLFVPLPVALGLSLELSSMALGALMLFVGYLTITLTRSYSDTVRRLVNATRHNQELLDELELQIKETTKSHELATQAVIDKSRFIALASHDLRQPLHALGMFQSSIRRKCLTPDTRMLFDAADQSIDALNEQFMSLLDVSRLDAGVIDPDREDLGLDSLLNVIAGEFQQLADRQGIELKISDTPAVVHSDSLLLSRILRNLISNACKNTSRGAVEVLIEDRSPDRIEVCVIDSGCGMPAEELQRVFSEFYQLGSLQPNSQSGVGLGLAIVHRLCNLLDIDIDVQSHPGEGSRFTLRIPSGDPARLIIEDDEDELLDIDGHHVLILDNDVAVLDGMRSAIEDWGCTVTAISSLDDGLRSLQTGNNTSPDLLLCDYHLSPEVTGVVAIRSLRQAIDIQVPAIIITGDSSAELLLAIDHQPMTLLHKPVPPLTLRTAIGRALSARPTPCSLS